MSPPARRATPGTSCHSRAAPRSGEEVTMGVEVGSAGSSGMSGAQWAALIANIGGTAATADVASRNSQRQAAIDEDRNALTEEQDLRRTALQESLADPFRHQMDQARGLTSLDMLRNFGSGGRRV